MSAPSDMRCMSMLARPMIGKTIASVNGIASAMIRPGRMPRLMKLTTMMMAIACISEIMNSRIALIDHDGLIRDESGLDADRQVGGDPRHRGPYVGAERKDVAAVPHGDREPDRRLAVDPNIGCGGSAKPRRTRAMSLKRSMRPPAAKLMFAISCSDWKPPDTRIEMFSSPVLITPAGRTLFCVCSAAIRADRSIPSVASSLVENSTKDHLVLRPQKLDLGHVGDVKQSRADVLDTVAQLALGKAVTGEAVDDAERIAEFVVEAGPDDARRQRVAHVADGLAHLVPGIGDLLRIGAALEVHENGRDTCPGETAQEVQMRRLLKGAFRGAPSPAASSRRRMRRATRPGRPWS